MSCTWGYSFVYTFRLWRVKCMFVSQSMGLWVELERLMKTYSINPSVCGDAARLHSDWPAQPNWFPAFSRPVDTTRIRSNYVLFYPTTASRLFSETCARERDGEGKWDLNRLRCHLALVYSLSLWEGRKHFGVFQSASVYCKSFRGMFDVTGRWYNQFMYCRVWNRPRKTRQLNLKLGFLKSRPWEVFSGHPESWLYSWASNIIVYWLAVQNDK